MTVSTQLGGMPNCGVNLAAVYSAADFAAGAPTFQVGQWFWTSEGAFQFCKSTAGTTAGDMVKVTNDGLCASGTATLLPTTEPAAVGVSVGTIAALGYGWVHRGCGRLLSGAAGVNAAASTTQAVQLYPSATAGRVTSTAGGNTPILGLNILTTTVGAAVTPYFASRLLATLS